MENKVKALDWPAHLRISFAPAWFRRSLLVAAGLTLVSSSTFADTDSPDNATIAKLNQTETARRQQHIFEANQALDAGDVFLQTGDTAKAEERYSFAFKTLQGDAPNSPGVARARNGLARIKLQQAQDLTKTGDFAAAYVTLDEAVQLDATVAPAAAKQRKQIAEAEALAGKQRLDPESTTNNPVVTPELRDKVATVQRLLFEGDRFFETGQYDRADERYRQVLVIDIYNKAARQKLDRLSRYKEHAAEIARASTRADAIYDIDRRWSLQELPDSQSNGPVVVQAKESNIARLTAKLNQIKIDNIAFDKTPVDDAVRILAEKAKQADPEHQGVNFVLKLATTQPSVAPAAGGAAAPAPAPVTPALVTLSLSNVSLADVLRLLTQYNSLKYKVEEYAIYLLPASENSDVLVTRTFVVPTGFFAGGLATPKASTTRGGGAGIATTVDSVKIDVKQQLTDQGVDFPPGATAAFLAGSSRLVVKSTADQMDRIDALLQAAGQEEDPQIEIETKFAEFTDDALKALQFNWVLARDETGSVKSDGQFQVGSLTTSTAGPVVQGGTSLRGVPDLAGNSLDNLLAQFNASGSANSNAQFFLGMTIGDKGLGVLANMISQLKGVDLLSAPKVTTKNRGQAKIEVDEQMTYPNQFTAPTYNTTVVQFAGNTTSVVAPPTPSSFDNAAIGVTMDVTPTAYADRRIDLEIKPDVTDFEGFIDYGSTISQGETDTPDIDVLEIYHIRQPVFNNRKIVTRLQVVDGQTVVMGGLIREDTQVINDKVPILGDLPLVGRAFQSKVDQRTKRNLMIFITARIIRSTGRPKFADAELTAPTLTTASTERAPIINVPMLSPGVRSDTKSVVNP
jgi:general secretion pathway protein D